MDKKISHNQAGLILCIFTISLKLSALPAIMYIFSQTDAYVVCFIATIFDFLGTLIIAHIISKMPNKSFYDLVKDNLGKVVAIIVQILLGIYLLGKSIVTLQELHDYFINTLFDKLNTAFFFGVLGLFILYTTTKDFRTLGRVMQLIFWPMFIGIAFTLIFPISDMQVDRLLPIFKSGFRPIYSGLSKTNFAFGDYLILLLLMGKIDVKQKFKKEILSYMAVTLSFIVAFFIIFTGSFGDFAISQTLALGELPLHSTTPSTIGKLEWLTVVIWTGILLLNAGLISVSCRQCFDNIFSIKNKNLSSTIITGIIMTGVVLTYLQLDSILNIVTNPNFSIVSGSLQVLFILILAISYLIEKKKKNKPENFARESKRGTAKC